MLQVTQKQQVLAEPIDHQLPVFTETVDTSLTFVQKSSLTLMSSVFSSQGKCFNIIEKNHFILLYWNICNVLYCFVVHCIAINWSQYIVGTDCG